MEKEETGEPKHQKVELLFSNSKSNQLVWIDHVLR